MIPVGHLIVQRGPRVEKFDFEEKMPGDTIQTWLQSLSLTAQAGGKGKFLFVFITIYLTLKTAI